MTNMKLPPFLRLLGDPHLGRKFTNGVPIHRRGDREEMVKETFQQSFENLPGIKLHVCVGDLFDKFRVPEEVILFAAQVYLDAARKHPEIEFVVLRGNHDASRDQELKSSFDVFTALVDGQENILVVDWVVDALDIEGERFVFYPWHPFKIAQKVAEDAPAPIGAWAIGHWDIESFGEDSASTDNMIPYSHLQGAKGIITGHYHNAKEFEHQGIPVKVTGSMQPYSHAEDPEGVLYVSHSLEQIQENLDNNPEHYANLNLRVLLKEGESPLADINCLSLTHKMVTSASEVTLDVEADNFDLKGIFFKTMGEFEVSSETTTELWDSLMETEE